MVTRVRNLLIATAVVLIAYVGATWLIGIEVQSRLEQREQQTLKNAPYLVLLHREYRRGVFGATEQATYALRGPFGGLGRMIPVVDAGSQIQFTVRNTIRHGPLPGLRTVALATLDTQVIPPPALARRLSAVAGGRTLLTIRTRLGWTGGTATTISSPAFHARLDDGAVLSSSGFEATFEVARGQASWRGHGSSAGFSAQGSRGRFALGGLSFDADRRRLADPLYVGDFHLKIAGLQFQGDKGPPVLMNGLALASGSAAHGEYIDSGAEFTAGEIKAANVTLSHVAYTVRLEHLQTASLAALTVALRDAQANATPGLPASSAGAVRDALERYGIELLVHDPVIEIPRLELAMPEGSFSLQARLAAHGLRREDMSGPAMMAGLVSRLEGTAAVRIDAALLAKLVSESPRGPALSAQLDALQRQGYLKREGAAWTAQIAYGSGKLTINGVAYPPRG
ncbi:MAG: YdgA family protein [Steroidobacteraceae bacterium]